MERRAGPPVRRLVIGFLGAPILPIAVVLVPALAPQGLRILPALVFGFVYYLIGCYLVIGAIAVPMYLILRRSFRMGPALCVACGFVIGAAIFLIPFLLQLAGVWPMFDSYQQGTHMIVVNRRFTDYGIRSSLEDAAESGAFGAAVAMIFWAIALRVRMPAATPAP